jgi:hypothetical protein
VTENSAECRRAPDVVSLPPEPMADTMASDLFDWSANDPIPTVVVGHVGDPRKWLCPRQTLVACGHTFVADRFAWVRGETLALNPPSTFDQLTFEHLVPRMTLEDVTDALGPGREIVSAAPFRSRDVASIDPRFNRAGSELVWLVRSYLTRDAAAASDPGRPLDASLVDDASGAVVLSVPLIEPDFEPWQLWLEARRDDVSGNELPPDELYPFFALSGAGDGQSLREDLVSGNSRGGHGSVTIGPSAPILVQSGRYELTQWLATLDQGRAGEPERLCSQEFEIVEDVLLRALFDPGKPCRFDRPLGPPGDLF